MTTTLFYLYYFDWKASIIWGEGQTMKKELAARVFGDRPRITWYFGFDGSFAELVEAVKEAGSGPLLKENSRAALEAEKGLYPLYVSIAKDTVQRDIPVEQMGSASGCARKSEHEFAVYYAEAGVMQTVSNNMLSRIRRSAIDNGDTVFLKLEQAVVFPLFRGQRRAVLCLGLRPVPGASIMTG